MDSYRAISDAPLVQNAAARQLALPSLWSVHLLNPTIFQRPDANNALFLSLEEIIQHQTQFTGRWKSLRPLERRAARRVVPVARASDVPKADT